jgi:large subunit ribosomal protein L10
LARGFSYRPSGLSEPITRQYGGKKGGETVNRTEKQEVIDELHGKMAKITAAILAEPKGLNVATVTELRRKCRDAQLDYRIVKNTLAVRAAKGTPIEPLAQSFKGVTALIMTYGDVVTPAKIISDFAKDREDFKIRTGIVEGKVIDVKGIQALAKLPGIQELRQQIAVLLAQPATKVARVLGTPGQQLARVLAARRDQLEKQSTGA